MHFFLLLYRLSHLLGVYGAEGAPEFVAFGIKKDEGGRHGAKFSGEFFAVLGLYVYAEDDEFSGEFFF